jgi:hypothetical protein
MHCLIGGAYTAQVAERLGHGRVRAVFLGGVARAPGEPGQQRLPGIEPPVHAKARVPSRALLATFGLL